jgi:hypothetical protein
MRDVACIGLVWFGLDWIGLPNALEEAEFRENAAHAI